MLKGLPWYAQLLLILGWVIEAAVILAAIYLVFHFLIVPAWIYLIHPIWLAFWGLAGWLKWTIIIVLIFIVGIMSTPVYRQ